LEQFALGDRPRATLTPDAYAWLAATFGGDLRATIALLYEAFQALTEPVAIDADGLRALTPPAHKQARGLVQVRKPLRAASTDSCLLSPDYSLSCAGCRTGSATAPAPAGS
jgi:hypothetical protein